jgi:transposase-like protein
MNTEELPETLSEAITYFGDETRTLEFMMALRWPDGVVRCNRCESDNVLFLANARRWKCRACKNQFSVKVGTVFEDSPLSLSKWIPALWVIVNAKNGVSSCELGRSLGVTQKTAWFMLQRIRLAMQQGSFRKLRGVCEADESYIGGKARYMHKKRRHKVGHAGLQKTAVQGLLQRNGKGKHSRVVLKVVDNTRKGELQGNVRKYILKGSTVNTDSLMSYDGLESDYDRQVIDHAVEYARGTVHTNGLENFWSLLKRSIRGTYVSVEPFHLFRYLDEQAFRFNHRKDEDGDRGRFLTAIAGIIGKRLTWKKLTGDNQSLPATA